MTMQDLAYDQGMLAVYTQAEQVAIVRREITKLTETAASNTRRIDVLMNELARAENSYDRDLEVLGQALIDNANSREYCSEFESTINMLNENLHRALPNREPQERDFCVSYTLTFHINVTATDEDSAEESAREMAREIETYADRNSNGDSNLECSDTEEVD